MVKQDSSQGRHWYVIQTYAGYEDAVKRALEQRIENLNLQENIFQVLVPKEKVNVISKKKANNLRELLLIIIFNKFL